MKLTRQGREALRFVARTLVQSGTKPYQSTATVISTNGTTATIRIDGAETTTPATLGVDVKPGDRVQVRVANSGVVVQGNNSAPPTDDAEAIAAKVRAQLAQESAVTAQEAADTAQETADAAAEAADGAAKTATNYITEIGTGGIDVTSEDASSSIRIADTVKVMADASNYSEQTADGFDVVQGGTRTARFGAGGAIIGTRETGQTVLGEGSMLLMRDSHTVLSASDEGVVVGADGAAVARFAAENVTWTTVYSSTWPLTWHASQPAQVAHVDLTIQPVSTGNHYLRIINAGDAAGDRTLFPVLPNYSSGMVVSEPGNYGYRALYSVEIAVWDYPADNVQVYVYVWGSTQDGTVPVAGEWASGYTTLNDLLDEVTIGVYDGDLTLDVLGDLTVNGTGVSLQGHAHQIADVTGLQSELDSKQDVLTFDTVPTQDSTNPVESGGIYDALQSAGGRSAYYATCSTAASTAAKAITVADWTPAAGDLLAVYFTTANTAATPTLSINGTSYGMYVGNSTANSTTNVLKWSAYTTLLLAFDGAYFRHIASQSIGTANQPDGAGTWHGSCSTAAGTAAKTVSVANFRLTPGAIVAVTCTTANTVSGQITLNVSSTGAKVVYIGNAATSATNPLLWDAGDALLFVYATYWRFLGRAKARVNQTVTTGTEIATVDGTPIYAPSGGGSGKVDAESTNGTDTAIIDNAGGAIEFAVTDGTNDVLVTIDTAGITIETTDGTDTSGIAIEPGNVTISNSGIAASHVMITGSAGDVQTSSVTSTELYRLSGVTSNVQNQIDAAKTTASVQHVTATLTVNIAANGSANGTLQATIPTGYAPVSVMCSALSNAFLMDVRVLSVDTSGLITYYIRNTSTSSAITNGTATFVVACVKTS